jgi:AcrR family transcriptional regulator
MQTDRQIEILDAFMKLVSRFGIDKTTMQDVAKEVGISVGVIYKDFENKEDLIDAYIGRLIQQFMLSCEQILDIALPPEQLLHEFIIGFFKTINRLVIQDRGFFQFISDEASIKYMRHNFHKKDLFLKELTGMIARIMDQGVREGVFEIEDIPKTASLFLSAFSKYAKMLFTGQDEAETLAGIEEMFHFIIRAIQSSTK